MPLGVERINERRQRPNPLINFIKPLPGPTSAYANDFLERVAAISAPIMKAHRIAVMSLEEYEPNPEFIGRNFNAGEVIQLVLKSRDGRWLPFRSVQMVMMHELAHCKQMNHSRAFYAVNVSYSAELRELWGKGYTGDGFWSRGKTLLSGEYEANAELPNPDLAPKSLCGGTYRSKRRKRKRKAKGGGSGEKPTYAERKQRRILKKFGVGGQSLGDDIERRFVLEGGKVLKGKPRVAGSARGRELRAAAALARFDAAKKEKKEDDVDEDVKIKKESDFDSDSEDDSLEDKAQAAHDLRMLHAEGEAFTKVCEDEDFESKESKDFFKELMRL